MIGPQTRVAGPLSGKDDLVIEGTVEGTVQGEALVTIAAGARVNGEVRGRDVIVAGRLDARRLRHGHRATDWPPPSCAAISKPSEWPSMKARLSKGRCACAASRTSRANVKANANANARRHANVNANPNATSTRTAQRQRNPNANANANRTRNANPTRT